MMYLRHEAGHAFNHAYELYRTREWRKLFGSTRRPYRDDYPLRPLLARLRPLHPRLVRAEASRRRLRRDVRGLARSRVAVANRATPAGGRMRKLQYVDRIARELGDVAAGDVRRQDRHHRRRDGADGRGVLPRVPGRRVADRSPTSRSTPTCSTSSRTPHRRRRRAPPRSCCASIAAPSSTKSTTGPACAARSCARSSSPSSSASTSCELVAVRERSRQQMIELTVYITTLAMTFLTGKKRLRHRRPAR